MIAVVALLSLLTLGQEFAAAGGGERGSLSTVGGLLLGVREHAALVGVFAFCLGAFLYYRAFFQSRLIPRWLSGWGIAAIVLMTTAAVLALFNNDAVTSYVPLALPIFLQEMVMAVWLIAKGYSPSAGSLGGPVRDEACDPRARRSRARRGLRSPTADHWGLLGSSPRVCRNRRELPHRTIDGFPDHPSTTYALASTLNTSTDSTRMNGGRGAVRAASRAARAASSDRKTSTLSVLPAPSLIHSAETKPGASRTRGATFALTMLPLPSICAASPASRTTTANMGRSFAYHHASQHEFT